MYKSLIYYEEARVIKFCEYEKEVPAGRRKIVKVEN